MERNIIYTISNFCKEFNCRKMLLVQILYIFIIYMIENNLFVKSLFWVKDVPLWSFIISIEGCQPSKQSIWSRYILSQKNISTFNFSIILIISVSNKITVLIIIVVMTKTLSLGSWYFWISLWMFDGFYRQFWFDKCPQLWQNINENLAINFIRNWSKTRVWLRLSQLSCNSINPLPHHLLSYLLPIW